MPFDIERVNRMRERILVQPSVCVERAKIYTDSFKETEGQPYVIRRAKAFADVLAKMTVTIFEEEIIVGKPTSKIRGGSISPELQCDWILDELDLLSTREADPFQPLTEEEKDVLREVVPYWQERSIRYHWNELVPEEAKKYDDLLMGGGAYCGNNQYFGHSAPDYGRFIRLGCNGLLQEIEERREKGVSAEEEEELSAMEITLHAVSNFGHRYAVLAQEMADQETDSRRKRELETIALTCSNVPQHGATNFNEAVQSAWFAYLCMMIENWGTGNCMLRIDQYLYPYYKKDMENGIINDSAAFDMISSLLLNCNCCCVVYSEQRSHGFAGNNSGTSFTIGGVKPDGSSAVNELSYLFLQAERAVNMVCDDIVVRISDNTPDDFLELACTVARDVGGKLKFLGDRTTIANLEYDEVPTEIARDYAIAGCTSPIVAGTCYNVPGGIISVATILELALNNGVQRLTGVKLGCSTGDAAQFTSYEQLWEAFCRQVDYTVPFLHQIKNADKEAFAIYSPSPYQSALSARCVEHATDIVRGGTKPYLWYALSLAGIPNAGDALAAIKKYVFEEKKITMQDVLDAIAANFEGYEHIRALLLRAPKFGNNDPYVDGIINEICTYVSDAVARYDGYLGAKSTTAAAAVTANVGLGMCLGATPDGRYAGTPIADGGISPVHGANASGMTATLLSIANLPHEKLRHGEVLNIRIDPEAVKDDDKVKKFASMIKAYVNAGGFLVQFNIVSTQTLRDAQLHPENHKDLVVRVATYAAYFVELGEDLQNDIINRMEFQSI